MKSCSRSCFVSSCTCESWLTEEFDQLVERRGGIEQRNAPEIDARQRHAIVGNLTDKRLEVLPSNLVS